MLIRLTLILTVEAPSTCDAVALGHDMAHAALTAAGTAACGVNRIQAEPIRQQAPFPAPNIAGSSEFGLLDHFDPAHA